MVLKQIHHNNAYLTPTSNHESISFLNPPRNVILERLKGVPVRRNCNKGVKDLLHLSSWCQIERLFFTAYVDSLDNLFLKHKYGNLAKSLIFVILREWNERLPRRLSRRNGM